MHLLRIEKGEYKLGCYNKIKEGQDVIQNLIKESKIKIKNYGRQKKLYIHFGW